MPTVAPGADLENPNLATLLSLLGDVDIYLLDQLMKGRIRPASRVLDAGCGSGRNLEVLLRCGVEVWGSDRSAAAVAEARGLAETISPGLAADRFRAEPIEALSFPEAAFDGVLAVAVLHFSEGEAHFHAMLRELGRVLAPGGMLFVRLGSTIGVESVLEPRGDRRYLQPEGSVRFLVDRELLLEATANLPGRLLEPLKTTVVDEQRAMTTWVVRKDS